MMKKNKAVIGRLAAGIGLLALAVLLPRTELLSEKIGAAVRVVLFMASYLTVGGDVLWRAVRNIANGQVFDENFLMSIATIGAFTLGEYSEAVAVMLFYQIGEFFQSMAVNRSRSSIASLMDIRPDFANVEKSGELIREDPEKVAVGDIIVIKTGERVPLDGIVLEGASQLDTAALTGESLPRDVAQGDDILSGSINLTGLLRVRVTKLFGESTVARILELVENAGDNKAKAENFITRFARWYTPAVVTAAVLLAVLPPLLFAQPWERWIERGLIFLVVSCPCALVISVPLSFFGGIGGASKLGILVKGGNYLEALERTGTVVFDKTGTLTRGNFSVAAIHPEKFSQEKLLELTAHAEGYSSHPISVSVQKAYNRAIERDRIGDVTETAGHGIRAAVDGLDVLAGNYKLMEENGVPYRECHMPGTAIHVAVNGDYAGHIIIADEVKPDAKLAIESLKALGVEKTVMLTGDREVVAAQTAKALGVDEYHAELLPQDKVVVLERLIAEKKPGTQVVFVGDGINDAPVLARADIGIAMGALGSDAAIEAADVVLMNDRPSDIALAVSAARRTMSIVRQNIWFALSVKAAVLLLSAFGAANMWWAVFADVGVTFIAVLNSMRALHISKPGKAENA